jgi:hypothetical protein
MFVSLPPLLGFLSLLPTLIAVAAGVWLIYFCISYEHGISCTLDKSSGDVTLENFSVLKGVKIEKIPLVSIRKIQLLTKPDLSPSNDPGGYQLIINFSSGEVFKLSYTLSKSEANALVTSLEDFLGYRIYQNFERSGLLK